MYIYVHLYIYIHNYIRIHIYMYMNVYIERPSADAADPNPEHVTPPRPTPGDVGRSRNIPDVINQLSKHTLGGES